MLQLALVLKAHHTASNRIKSHQIASHLHSSARRFAQPSTISPSATAKLAWESPPIQTGEDCDESTQTETTQLSSLGAHDNGTSLCSYGVVDRFMGYNLRMRRTVSHCFGILLGCIFPVCVVVFDSNGRQMAATIRSLRCRICSSASASYTLSENTFRLEFSRWWCAS